MYTYLTWGIVILLAFGRGHTPPESINDSRLELSARRYKKGLEILRIIHEKLLELDYHYSGFLQEYAQDPHSEKDWHPSLQADLVLQDLPVGERRTALCVLDFSIRLQECLFYIQSETSLLYASNELLKEEAGRLFGNYTNFLNYTASLDSCRQADGWEEIDGRLESYLEQCRKDRLQGKEEVANRAHINLEFAVDRLLYFMDKYQYSIRRGRLSYERFEILLAALEKRQSCAVPADPLYTSLIEGVSLASQKFRETYNLAELEGSKLKDLLYGW
ncbi:MAG: hypothetical protein GYB31_15220 [Bacteroidetes bacterium]|nr:hypothetical protein [Bacteroidota bacterium]